MVSVLRGAVVDVSFSRRVTLCNESMTLSLIYLHHMRRLCSIIPGALEEACPLNRGTPMRLPPQLGSTPYFTISQHETGHLGQQSKRG